MSITTPTSAGPAPDPVPGSVPGSVPDPGAAPVPPRRHGVRAAWIMMASGWSANQFSALLGAYRSELGLSESAVTGLFALYVIGLVPGLLVGGPLADRVGRRPVALTALALNLVSTGVLMLGAGATGWLWPGRFVTGFSAGALLAAGSAWIKELSSAPHVPAGSGTASTASRRAGLFVSAGFASGGLVAALIARWAPAPMITAYIPHALLAVGAGLLALKSPETVTPPAGGGGRADSAAPMVPGAGGRGSGHGAGGRGLGCGAGERGSGCGAGELGLGHGAGGRGAGRGGSERGSGCGAGERGSGCGAGERGADHGAGELGSGRGAGEPGAGRGAGGRGAGRGVGGVFRRRVLPVAPWVFAAPSVGFVTLPGLVHGGLVYAGVATAVVPGSGLLVQPLARRVAPRHRLATAVAGLLTVTVGFGAAAFAASLGAGGGGRALALAAAAILGAGYGFVLTYALTEVTAMAPPHRLARLTAYFWTAAYVGMLAPYAVTLLSGVVRPPALLTGAAALAALSCALLVTLHAREKE